MHVAEDEKESQISINIVLVHPGRVVSPDLTRLVFYLNMWRRESTYPRMFRHS